MSFHAIHENKILEKISKYTVIVEHAINSEISERNLFSQIALKNIFATSKVHDLGMIPTPVHDRVISRFCKCFIFKNLGMQSLAKMKTITKIPELTVVAPGIGQTSKHFECTVKPVISGHSKVDKTKILLTNGSLMNIKSIAECNTFDLY